MSNQSSASERVAGEIRKLIADGSFRSGDRLPAERQLATSLGVSRPALREGARLLAAGGLLEIRRGSGIYVADVDFDEVIEMRLALEPLAAGLAAGRRSAAEARRLGELARKLEATVQEPQDFARTDAEVHSLVAAASGNRLLAGALRDLDQLTAVSRLQTSSLPAVRAETLRQVTDLAEAVIAGERPRATTAMARHLEAIRSARS